MVNGILSSSENVTCGSILGVLLFILYVNDMYSFVNYQLILYADDSALLVSGKDVNEIDTMLGQELGYDSEWLESNKLSLHLGKTERILFASKSKLKSVNKMIITCNEN